MENSRLSERVRKMMQNFIQHHDEGCTIPQIAKMYNISDTIIYIRLEQIAKRYGRRREELLQQHKSFPTGSKERAKLDRTKFSEVNQKLEEGIDVGEKALKELDIFFKEDEGEKKDES